MQRKLERRRKLAAGLLSVASLIMAPSAARADDWRALLYHVHSIYSLDNPEWVLFKPSVAQVVQHADQVGQSLGLECAVTLTDHNTRAGCSDPGFAPVGVAEPICGEEWGGLGHAGAINYQGTNPITPGLSNAAMVVETHARGGTVVANHPRSNNWQTDLRLGVDAIEVWSVSFWDGTDDLALAWWQRLLLAGEQVTAVGGSDSHFVFAASEVPTNLVLSASNSPDDMMAGVRAGHVVILGAPGSPCATLEADGELDGVYESVVGDVIPVGQGNVNTAVAYRATVHGVSPGDRLELIEGASKTSFDLAVGDGESHGATRVFVPTDRTFVRAEVRRPGGAAPYCLTNPIYFVGAQAPTGTEGTIAGNVRGNGQPLAGATVTAAPGEFSKTTTQADGTFSLVVPNGSYTLSVQASGYASGTVSGVSVASGTTAVDVNLSPGGCAVAPRADGGTIPPWSIAALTLLLARYMDKRRTPLHEVPSGPGL